MQDHPGPDGLHPGDGVRRPIEAADPAADGRLFRRCLGQYGTGIAIITTEVEGKRAAVTVNSFASVSLDPPLVLWSIGHTSRSVPAFKAAKGCAINILAASQMGVSRHFSSSIEDKFADAAWSPGMLGFPLLDGCLAHLECEPHAQIDAGDHTIMVCRVRYASRFDGEPLLFIQGQYGVADTHPASIPTTDGGPSVPGSWFEETIVSQIFEAHHVISSNFDEHRRDEGVDVPVARILACLSDRPGSKVDEVARAAYLGQRGTEDAVALLAERGMLAISGEGHLTLTEPGMQLRESLRARWRAFQQQQLAEIPDADMRATSRTLARLISQNRTAGR